jgi:hypothetical protein
MFWDDLVRRWRRSGAPSQDLLRAIAGHTAVLPAPRPQRRSHLPWVVLAAIGLAALLLLLQGGQAQAFPAPFA